MLWISNWIVYTSCGLLKKFVFYILMLHLSGEYLCIMASQSHSFVPLIFTGFLYVQVWALRMVNEKGEGVRDAK